MMFQKSPAVSKASAVSKAKSESDLRAVQALLAELARQRPRLPLEDDLTSLDKADLAAENLRLAAVRHGNRIAAIAAVIRQLDLEQRQRDRDAAVATLGKNLQPYPKVAGELQDAIAEVGSLYKQLAAIRDAVLADWPAALPPRAISDLPPGDIQAELSAALHAVAGPIEVRYPRPVAGLPACAQRQIETLLRRLRDAPLSGEDEKDVA